MPNYENTDIIYLDEGVLMDKFVKDKIVTGYVTGIESYGIFVSLDDYYDGLIHISEISDDYVRNISDYVVIGEKINTKIIGIDEKKHQLKLSIKDLDYRMDKGNKIEETTHGFDTLKSNLPLWIKEKIDEISKNNAEK